MGSDALVGAINAIIVPLIHIFAGATGALFAFIVYKTYKIAKKTADFSEKSVFRWRMIYNLFIVMISVFPFLGMLGTVTSLLTLDMSGEMETLKSNFFLALITTFWGIVYSVFFKLLNAFVQPTMEEYISSGKGAPEAEPKGAADLNHDADSMSSADSKRVSDSINAAILKKKKKEKRDE